MNLCYASIIAAALAALGIALRIASLQHRGVRITLPEAHHSTNGRKSGREYADTYEELS